MNACEDVVLYLKENNGRVPKYEDFWVIVSEYIEDKTTVSDRRHNWSDDEGDVVVYMAMANSCADMYRLCVEIAKSKNRDIVIPTYAWFLLQFWPTTKTASNTLHYTGRFKVKRMVQARTLRKHNADLHYTKVIYSFMRKMASNHADAVTFASVDAKCKISVGEPDFPIISVSRGKAGIVGSNQTFKVGDHDFSKLSLIPDAILIHDIHKIEDNDEGDPDTEENEVKSTLGSWYIGQVFYGIKSMESEGSMAWRGVAELLETMKSYHDIVPERVYIYDDRRITFRRVQMA